MKVFIELTLLGYSIKLERMGYNVNLLSLTRDKRTETTCIVDHHFDEQYICEVLEDLHERFSK